MLNRPIPSALITLFIAAGISMADDPMDGVAIALQSRQQWTAGNLLLVNLPGIEKKVLVNDACMGPCFSPDGAKVAYLNFGDGYIYTIAGNGSETSPTSTGVKVFLRGVDDIVDGVGIYWLSIGGTEYFYWSNRYADTSDTYPAQDFPGIFRANINGTGVVERLVTGRYFWAGYSADGTRGGGILMGDTTWYAIRIDLATGETLDLGSGCNLSLSPDGTRMLNNLNTGPWDPTYKHTNAILRNWDLSNESYILADCNFDGHRWSHHDANVVMWRNFNQYGVCPAEHQAVSGVLLDLATKERIAIGPYIPYDYWPGDLGQFQWTVDEPIFVTPEQTFTAGAATVELYSITDGASVRYTLDGSEPSSSHGTELPESGVINFEIPQGQTYTVKAIAFKDGTLPSIVSMASYAAPDSIPDITITSPVKQAKYSPADAMLVSWVPKPGVELTRADVSLSLDGGRTWGDMTTTSLTPQMENWENFSWTVQSEFCGISIHSSTAMVRVAQYGNEQLNGVTEPFFIVDPENCTSILGTADDWWVDNAWKNGTNGEAGVVAAGDAIVLQHQPWGKPDLNMIDSANTISVVQGEQYLFSMDIRQDRHAPVSIIYVGLTTTWGYGGAYSCGSTDDPNCQSFHSVAALPGGYSLDDVTGKAVVLTAQKTGDFHIIISRFWDSKPSINSRDTISAMNWCPLGGGSITSAGPGMIPESRKAGALRITRGTGSTFAVSGRTGLRKYSIEIVRANGTVVGTFAGAPNATFHWAPNAAGIYYVQLSGPGITARERIAVVK